MSSRREDELNFVKTRDPIASVEVDLDSIPEELCGYQDIVLAALKAILGQPPKLRATMYVYESVSVNFGQPGYSVFFGFAGGERHLLSLLSAFKKVEGVKAKASDSILARQAVCQFHIEGGEVWFPEEECIWQTFTNEAAD